MPPTKFIWISPLLALAALGGAAAQVPPSDPAQLQRALAEARAAGAAAGRRAAELEAQASTAQAAVERTAREAAGIALGATPMFTSRRSYPTRVRALGLLILFITMITSDYK